MGQLQEMHDPAGWRPEPRFDSRAFAVAVGSQASHLVQTWSDEADYAQTVGHFLAGGLAAGQPALVVATPSHRDAISAVLAELDPRLMGAELVGRLVHLDAHATLTAISVGGVPDRTLFFDVIGRALDETLLGTPGGVPFVHGEMVDLLCAAGDVRAARRLEELWNEIAERRRFHLLCTYASHTFATAGASAAYDEICGLHTHALPSSRLCGAEEEARLRELARVEQRARALESELALRRQVEDQLRTALDERERAHAMVRDRERDFTDSLENAAEAIHWAGPDGTILWANRAELEMLGYAADEYIGRNIREFHEDASVIEDMLRRLAAGEPLRDYEARLRHRDGSTRVGLTNSNVLWRDGRFVHTRCFTRDVTEARRAAAEREELLERERAARREAEIANQAKAAFLAMMSHELRTPLNAIGGYVELLTLGIRGPLSGEQREDLARIRRSQGHLLGLINQVLNYSCIESRAIGYEPRDVHVDTVVSQAEELVRPQLDTKKLRLVVESCPDDTVAHVDGDKACQVLLNLLGNAVKFTDPGGEVRIRCELATDAGGAPAVLVHVTDTGRGIPTDKVSAIFEPFMQVETGLTRTQEGTGLGLAISRALARGMGGDVTVQSTLGRGSTFTLALPRATPAQRGS